VVKNEDFFNDRNKIIMIKKPAIIVLTFFLMTISSLSGCVDSFNFNDGTIIYEAHPVKIQYNILYGYRINCSGIGNYEIQYDCDKPETLVGSVTLNILYNRDYEETTLANNSMISWSISGVNDENYELGIVANVLAESYLISDLYGENALTLQEIRSIYPNLVAQYCKAQIVNNTAYINPDDLTIKTIASNILNQEQTNNSFILAKKLFIWLKENTNYQIHNDKGSAQPAHITCLLKTGDCDDLSFLYISLCRSIDIPARFIRGFLVEENNGDDNTVAHAWVEVFVGGNIGNNGWVPVECAGDADKVEIEINQNFGVEDASHLRLFLDDGSNESLNTSISGIRVQYEQDIDIDITSFVEVDNYMMLESKELHVDESIRSYK